MRLLRLFAIARVLILRNDKIGDSRGVVAVPSGSKAQMETPLALVEVEILFVPGFGTKRLERKAGKWPYSLP